MCKHSYNEVSVMLSIAESIYALSWRNSNFCKTYLHSVF